MTCSTVFLGYHEVQFFLLDTVQSAHYLLYPTKGGEPIQCWDIDIMLLLGKRTVPTHRAEHRPPSRAGLVHHKEPILVVF